MSTFVLCTLTVTVTALTYRRGAYAWADGSDLNDAASALKAFDSVISVRLKPPWSLERCSETSCDTFKTCEQQWHTRCSWATLDAAVQQRAMSGVLMPP